MFIKTNPTFTFTLQLLWKFPLGLFLLSLSAQKKTDELKSFISHFQSMINTYSTSFIVKKPTIPSTTAAIIRRMPAVTNGKPRPLSKVGGVEFSGIVAG